MVTGGGAFPASAAGVSRPKRSVSTEATAMYRKPSEAPATQKLAVQWANSSNNTMGRPQLPTQSSYTVLAPP